MNPGDNEPQMIRFGPFTLHLRNEELSREGVAVKLPPQPFKVLVCLTRHAGQLITREELQQQIWGNDTFVDFDKGLNFCIKQIREALGDNAQAPQYIETLPRRGYRFIAPVEHLTTPVAPVNEEAQASAALQPEQFPRQALEPKRKTTKQPLRLLAGVLAVLLPLTGFFLWQRFAAPSNPPEDRLMLAVLPFENLNGDTAQDYFSDGLTEEMIAQLGRFRPQRLGVIARTTALTYKKTHKDIRQIGQELGVNYVLEGSVRREAGRVRITAQLIQVSDQTHLWAETYERNEQDMLQIQSEVARRVAHALTAELLNPPGTQAIVQKTTHPEAYDAYLKGRFLVTKDTPEDIERSIPYFEQAIAKDPTFAHAYAGAVSARVLLATWRNTPAPEVLPKAKAEALKALELDETLAEAHAALGAVNFWLEWNWPAAQTNLQRAIELNPSDPQTRLYYADYLLTAGQAEAGVREVKEALQLDPVSLLTNGLAAYFYLRAGRFAEAIAQANRMLELEPKSPAAHRCLFSAYYQQGLYPEALEVGRRSMRQAGLKPEEIAARTQGEPLRVIQQQRRENLAEIQKALAAREQISALWVANTYAQLDETEQALTWLEKAVAAREPLSVFFHIHPEYTKLRANPRFTALARQVGLAR